MYNYVDFKDFRIPDFPYFHAKKIALKLDLDSDLMKKSHLLAPLFLKSGKEHKVCGNFVSMLMLSFLSRCLQFFF